MIAGYYFSTRSYLFRSDTIKKTLKVEYEGFPRDEAFTEYICAEGSLYYSVEVLCYPHYLSELY